MNEDEVRTIIDKQLKEEKSKLIELITREFTHTQVMDVGEIVRILARWRDS